MSREYKRKNRKNPIKTEESFLTAGEEKLILVAISKIKRDDENHGIYKFQYNELIELMGEGDYVLVDITSSLIGKMVPIRDKPNLQISWLISAEYRDCIVELEFSQKLIPYLLDFKDFILEHVGTPSDHDCLPRLTDHLYD